MFSNVFNTIWSNPANRIIEKQIHGETIVLAENEGRLCAAKRVGNEFVSLILSGIATKVNTALDKALTCAQLKDSNLQLVGPQLTVLPRMLGGAPDSFPKQLLTNLEELKKWFQQHPEFTTLELGGCDIGLEKLVILAAVLPYSQITHLDLSYNEVECEGVKAIAKALPWCKISRLCLGSNQIGPVGIEALSESLPFSQVFDLSLYENPMDERGARALAAVLPYSLVSQLDMGVINDGMVALASILPFSKITSLHLWSSNIKDRGFQKLVQVLPQSQLVALSLCGYRITADNAKALAMALPHSRIVYLNLQNCNLEFEELKTIAAVLPKSRISHLYLDRNPFSEKGIVALARVLPESSICKLVLPDNKFSENAIRALLAGLPTSQVGYLDSWLNQEIQYCIDTINARHQEFLEICCTGTLEQVTQLLDKGNPVHAVDNKNIRTPLHLAVERNYRDLVTLLLKHKATLIGDYDGKTPLDLALELGHNDLVELLQNNGSSFTPPPEVEVPKSYYCPKTQQIFYDPVIAANGKTYEREAIEEHFKTHNTIPDDNRVVVQSKILIPNAFCKGLITELIQKYPHLEQQTYIPNASRNACLAALRAQDVSSLKDLLVKDSRLLSVGFPDGRLIELACRTSPELLKVVIEAYPTRPYFNHLLCIKAAEGLGAEGVRLIFSMLPKQEPVSLRLAILKAAELTSGAYTRALLELGANPNAIDSEGRSLLHLAVGAGSKDVIRVLMEYEADLKSVDRQGHTPLQIAEHIQHFELIRYIKQKKIELKFRPFLAPLQEQINAQGRVIQQLRGALVETQTSLGNIVPLLGANPSLSSVADELTALQKRIDQHFS